MHGKSAACKPPYLPHLTLNATSGVHENFVRRDGFQPHTQTTTTLSILTTEHPSSLSAWVLEGASDRTWAICRHGCYFRSWSGNLTGSMSIKVRLIGSVTQSCMLCGSSLLLLLDLSLPGRLLPWLRKLHLLKRFQTGNLWELVVCYAR